MNAYLLPTLRVYRVELEDGRECYLETDTPWEVVDYRSDIAKVELQEQLTAWILCALMVDQNPVTATLTETQRKLAISAVVWGANVKHAIATVRRVPCACYDCVVQARATA